MFDPQDITVALVVFAIAEVFGVCLAVHAVLKARSSQAALAWSIALITFPYLAIPLYVVFGRSRFEGYVEAIQGALTEADAHGLPRWREDMAEFEVPLLPGAADTVATIQRHISTIGFTRGNDVQLLVDGSAVYDAMLAAIAEAELYIFVQFYIVRDDVIGRRFRDALVERARAGVKVRFLYDEIGSIKLPSAYLDEMEAGGVRVTGFKTTRGRGNRTQINFRNHRKLIVVDGRVGFIGGFNLGDEYYGFRDTHLRIVGPSAQHIHLSFAKDWYWATRTLPGVIDDADYPPPRSAGDTVVGIAATGPGDPTPNCSVLVLSLISAAKQRLWIASPYFVPDDVCQRALQAAAMRGVDVRVLLPDKADQVLVELASFTYYTSMLDAGVKLYRYKDRFMHQKVVLVDDVLASVGTVNLDNRSLYLNFEATALVPNSDFVAAIDEMLQRDLDNARVVTREQYCDRHIVFRFFARLARLAAPIL